MSQTKTQRRMPPIIGICMAVAVVCLIQLVVFSTFLPFSFLHFSIALLGMVTCFVGVALLATFKVVTE